MITPDRPSQSGDAPIKVGSAVEQALQQRMPVVALESTIISHGLPQPANLQAAIEFEEILRQAGVVPATVAVLDGVPTVGLDASGIERIAFEPMMKASVRDLPMLMASGRSAATTVAATAFLADRAGVRVFATGGLGGVHRGASETFDESADLWTLSHTPILVVSAGVKSVLDIGATLERLETLGVPVVGYRTDRFPRFWLRASDAILDWSVSTPHEVAKIMAARDRLRMRQGIVLANPIPEDLEWDIQEHERVLAQALHEANERGISGKAVTPFLLARIVELSDGRSLEGNLHLARNNVRTAADIAIARADLD